MLPFLYKNLLEHLYENPNGADGASPTMFKITLSYSTSAISQLPDEMRNRNLIGNCNIKSH